MKAEYHKFTRWEEDILKAIGDLEDDKVPGQDGFSLAFYKKC